MNLQKNWHRILVLLLTVVLVYWTANNLGGFQRFTLAFVSAALPFLLGAGLAFVLNLPVKFIEKRLAAWRGRHQKWHRLVSVTLSILLVILLSIFLVFLVIPDLQTTIGSFIEIVPEETNNIINFLSAFIENNPKVVVFVQELNLDINTIRENLVGFVQTFVADFISRLVNIVSTAISSVVTILIAFIFAIYILVIKENLIRQTKKIIYSLWSLRWANYFVNVGKKANEIFSSFVGGQITEGFILGVFVYLGMWIFGFPYRLSISVLTGTMALIPIYGAIIGGIVGFILIAVVSFPQALWFILFIVVIQQIEGNIIYPRVVGSSVGLPGIWVLFAVTMGGAFFGLTGMLLSVPVVSLIYALASATVNYRLAERGLVIETETNNISPKQRLK